jgi:hypothetical protein
MFTVGRQALVTPLKTALRQSLQRHKPTTALAILAPKWDAENVKHSLVACQSGPQGLLVSKRVLPMTVRLLRSMALTATMGVSSPAMATGMLTAL